MTGVAPVDGTGATPTDIPAEGPEVAGEAPRYQDGSSVYTPDERSVVVAYCHGGQVSHSWHQSLMNSIAYDKSMGLNLIGQVPFAVHCSGPNSLVEGRNLAVTHFLDETECEWLVFIDTDMGFAADAVERLVLAADPVKRPIVGGLCFALKHMAEDHKGGFRVMPAPTLFMFAKNGKQGVGFANRFIYPPEALVQVAGTGAAFIVIHRSVLETMRAKHGDHWYDFVQYEDGTTISEDLSFCWRAHEIGQPIFVDTRIKVTHHKQFWLGEGDYQMPDREPMARTFEAALDDGHNMVEAAK